MKYYSIISILIFLVSFTDCGQSKKKKATPKEIIQTTITFDLACEKQQDSLPHVGLDHYYKLYLKSPSVKEAVFIDTLLTCTQLDTAQYTQYEVPDSIEKVVVAYYAGGGPMYYSYFEQPNKIVVMQGFQEEGGAYIEEMTPKEIKEMEAALKFKEYKVITFNPDGSYDVVTIPEQEDKEKKD